MAAAAFMESNQEDSGKKRAKSEESAENVPPSASSSKRKATVDRSDQSSRKLENFFAKVAEKKEETKVVRGSPKLVVKKSSNQGNIAQFFQPKSKDPSIGKPVQVFHPYSSGPNASIADARTIGRLKACSRTVEVADLKRRPWRYDLNGKLGELTLDNWHQHWEIAYIAGFCLQFKAKMTRVPSFTTLELASEICACDGELPKSRTLDALLQILVRNVWRTVTDRNLPAWGSREYLRYLNCIINSKSPSSKYSLPKSVVHLFAYLRNGSKLADQPLSFETMSAYHKMKILKSLIDWQLSDYSPIHSTVNSDFKELGPSPIGRDELGAVYYHFDKDLPLVFVEKFYQASEDCSLPVAEFSLACQTPEELAQLLVDLKSRHTSKHVNGNTKSLYYALSSLIEHVEQKARAKEEKLRVFERQEQRRLERLEKMRERRRARREERSEESGSDLDEPVMRRSTRIRTQWRERYAMEDDYENLDSKDADEDVLDANESATPKVEKVPVPYDSAISDEVSSASSIPVEEDVEEEDYTPPADSAADSDDDDVSDYSD